MSFLHMILQVGAVLVMMVGLIVTLGYLAKRTQGFGMQGGKHMTCLQTLPLGAKEKAVLLEVGGQKILLGVTAQQVSCLWSAESMPVDFVQAGSVDKVLADGDTKDTQQENNSFSDCLKKIIARDYINRKMAC